MCRCRCVVVAPAAAARRGVAKGEREKAKIAKFIKRGHVSADFDEMLRGVVVLHGVAVPACRSDVVMVVVLKCVVDSVNAVEPAGIVCCAPPTEATGTSHDALRITFEYSPCNFLFLCYALVAAYFYN